MSISLNDHENRIKSLENLRGHGKIFQYDTLYSGQEQRAKVPLTHPLTDYDFVWVHLASDGTGRQQSLILPQKPIRYMNSGGYVICHQSGYCITTATPTSWNTTTLVIQECQGGILAMYGLKLYYSFSYNIIYRAMHLLEKFMSQTKEVLAYEY